MAWASVTSAAEIIAGMFRELADEAAGPIQTDSSASLTYLASRSASEWTTTVLMPSSRQARWTRRAISPRFAIRTFSNMTGCSADHEQRFAEFDRLAVFDEDGLDDTGGIGFDFVQQLHGLDDAQGFALLDALADLHEGIGTRRRRTVEGADHRRLDDMAFRQFVFVIQIDGGRSRCTTGGRHGSRHHVLLHRRSGDGTVMLGDTHFLFAFGHFQFGDTRFLNEVDEFLEFAQIHELLLFIASEGRKQPAAAGLVDIKLVKQVLEG